MARIQAPKSRIDEFTLGERTGVVRHVEGVDRRQLDLDGTPPTASGEIETGVDGQSVKPGVKASRIT